MKFRIQYFKELSSTNTLAVKLAKENAGEGLVIITDYQTKGRGKLDRKWISPRGKNLLFSLLLRPPMTPREAPLLTQIACRSVAHVLNKRYGLETTFKRPNDILVNGKKICGILVEASTSSKNQLDSAVIGVGLNVNSLVEELLPEATSIRELKGKTFSLKVLLNALLRQLNLDLMKIYGKTKVC